MLRSGSPGPFCGTKGSRWGGALRGHVPHDGEGKGLDPVKLPQRASLVPVYAVHGGMGLDPGQELLQGARNGVLLTRYQPKRGFDAAGIGPSRDRPETAHRNQVLLKIVQKVGQGALHG
ncbi:hypothetical protein GCM10022407_14540 [Hymenobacter antarcticus]|uniref:Uncharacterized protein n=1 Tax=Hymenobacter antarcticus TaxID=486270 RepID=A0ABP7PQX6_9BACT